MTRIERSILISAPVNEVFAYASDHRKWPEWFEGVSSRTVWDFQSLGNETRFTYTLEYYLPFPRLSGWVDTLIMKPQWEKLIRISLENLKRRVEQECSPGITPGVSPGKGSHT